MGNRSDGGDGIPGVGDRHRLCAGQGLSTPITSGPTAPGAICRSVHADLRRAELAPRAHITGADVGTAGASTIAGG
jgi:hypothetical protein